MSTPTTDSKQKKEVAKKDKPTWRSFTWNKKFVANEETVQSAIVTVYDLRDTTLHVAHSHWRKEDKEGEVEIFSEKKEIEHALERLSKEPRKIYLVPEFYTKLEILAHRFTRKMRARRASEKKSGAQIMEHIDAMLKSDPPTPSCDPKHSMLYWTIRTLFPTYQPSNIKPIGVAKQAFTEIKNGILSEKFIGAYKFSLGQLLGTEIEIQVRDETTERVSEEEKVVYVAKTTATTRKTINEVKARTSEKKQHKPSTAEKEVAGRVMELLHEWIIKHDHHIWNKEKSILKIADSPSMPPLVNSSDSVDDTTEKARDPRVEEVVEVD